MSSNSEQNNCDAHLQAAAVEIEALKQALHEKQTQLLAMESVCLRESNRQVELEDSVIAWQDKYDRLYESHKRVQKVNQSLEDKLLKLVDRNTGERAQLTSDVATLSVRLAQANYNIAKLQREIERYKADINLAIQLLQCKPDSFVPQKVSSLPIDIQSKVSTYMRLETNSHSDSEGSTSGVGVATSSSYKVLPASDSPPPACPFPPTAMVYSMRGLDGKSDSNSTTNLLNSSNCNNNSNCSNNSNNNINSNITSNNNNNTTNITHNNSTTNTTNVVNCNNNNNNNSLNVVGEHEMISPSIMAKFLEEELKASEVKHCDTCQCSNRDLTVLADVSRSYSVSTQTPYGSGNGTNITNLNEPLTATLCLRCNSNLNSPSRTNSPYLMKLVKSSDSVISETKSSVSDLNDVDKLFTPAKRDDLMVNPILGHHRLCDRTAGSGAQHQNGMFLMSGANKLNLSQTTTSLGNYQPSDMASKYMMESCDTPPFSNGNGYQRRFIDGGGTALDLIELRTKYDVSNTPKLDLLPQQHQHKRRDDINGLEDIEDEAKPLLSGVSQLNLHDHERKCELDHTKTTPPSACGGQRNNLAKTTISGSVNSLWSKTSSCEGAKMFENFNRNLIKTIKAENPKNLGPRLCAMRIQQNGQSNILLDNIESIEAVTPIIYTRRERFLDEELDDTKDIITSKHSAMSNNMPEKVTKLESKELVITEELVKLEEIQETVDSCSKALLKEVEKEKCAHTVEALENSVNEKCNSEHVIVCIQPATDDNTIDAESKTCNVLHESKTGDGDAALSLQNQIQPTVTAQAYTESEQASDRKITSTFRGEQQLKTLLSSEQQLLKATLNYGAIHQTDSICKNSQNSKSYTQSSSISDVIDFQESVMLRRQQLSRVAEWVQNNSQQLEQQQQQQILKVAQHCVSASENVTGTVTGNGTADSQPQPSYSTIDQYDSISMEKLSTDSGYKTTPQPQTNGYVTEQNDCVKVDETEICKRNNNTYYRRTGRSGLPIAYNAATAATAVGTIIDCSNNINVVDSNSSTTTTSIISPEQPTCDILNYKYYPSESDRTLAIKAELHTTTQHVDIAQMEYNVKQFLLKQNEWSIRNSRNASLTATTGTAAHKNCNSNAQLLQQHRQHQQAIANATKSIRHSKLISSAGIGPGVGERIKITTIPSAITSTATKGAIATATTTTAATTPHRTETNL